MLIRLRCTEASVCPEDRRQGKGDFNITLVHLSIYNSLFVLVRVALARAVYAPSKYVLLDDPLSAVVCVFWKVNVPFVHC